MPIDTLLVYCGVYGEAADALEDYELIKDLHTEANLIDAYDAAVIDATKRARSDHKKHRRRPAGGVLGGGVGLPRDWRSPCSRLQPSAEASCSPPPVEVRSSALSPDTRQRE